MTTIQFTCVGILLCHASHGSMERTTPDDRALMEAVARGYEANRAAIPYGSADFLYTTGSAADAEAAVAGDGQSRGQGKGRYVFDSSNRKFEIVYSLGDLTKFRQLAGDRWIYGVNSRRMLTNGRLTLSDVQTANPAGDKIVHTAQIDAGTSRFFSELTFPLKLGDEEIGSLLLHHDIEQVLKNQSGWTLKAFADDASLDGVPVVYFHLGLPDGDREYWVDVSRGSLPIRVKQNWDHGFTMYLLGDFRQVNESAWLPFKQTIYASDRDFKQIQITDADFKTRPPQSSFRMEFDEPIAMINSANMVHYSPQKVWNLSRLPGPSSPSATKIQSAAAPAAEVVPQPGERDSSWRWGNVLMAAGALLVASLISFRVLKART